MGRFRQWFQSPFAGRALFVETGGLGLITAGLHQIYQPAAFIFAGAALVFIAQGLERRE